MKLKIDHQGKIPVLYFTDMDNMDHIRVNMEPASRQRRRLASNNRTRARHV